MKPLYKMTNDELHELIHNSDDAEDIDKAFDELERRHEAEQFRDHTEDDYYAAKSDLYEMWRNEY
jgi:hypothetical protein